MVSGLKKIVQALFKKRETREVFERENIEDIFCELEEVHIKKQRIAQYLKEINIKEKAHKQYEHLDAETINQVNKLAQKANEIEEKKKNLKGRLISNNAALNRLAKYEDEVPDLIKEMQVAEKRRRETESHMLYLKEERGILEEERESLLTGYSFLRGFSMMLVVIIGVCLLVSFIMLQVFKEKVWFILSGLVGVAIIGVVAIILIKDKLEKEIKKNGILQQKAVRYLNKNKIKFFNQTQYLEFQYRKLGVDSVAKLELYYTRYLKNKNNERIYLQMNDFLTEIEEDMLEILHHKGIESEAIGEISEWLLQPKCLAELKRLEEERIKTEHQLEALKCYEDEMWQELKGLYETGNMGEQILTCLEGFQGENRLDKIRVSA